MPEQTTPATVHHIPLAEIDPKALPRDRTVLDSADTDELINSISLHGLRMPIEVFPLETPEPPFRYGLLSGYRRFEAFRRMHEGDVARDAAEQPFAAIPAFIRPRGEIADQLVQLVEENAIRADLSPWEQGHIAVAAWRRGIFPTLDAAVNRLYMCASRQKRARLRAIAQVVEEFDGLLTDPELLSLRRLMRIHNAIQQDFAEIMRDTLEMSLRKTPEAQWDMILPYLIEAEEIAAQPAKNAPPPRPGRPRRMVALRDALIVRRARTPEGWVLHFAGEDATSSRVDEIIDDMERRWGTKGKG